MDVSVKAIFLPQDPERLDHALAGIVGALDDAGAEKQPLDVIAPVKLDREIGQLARGKRRAGRVVGAAVHAVFAVIYARI